jgi:hypothetical protein
MHLDHMKGSPAMPGIPDSFKDLSQQKAFAVLAPINADGQAMG